VLWPFLPPIMEFALSCVAVADVNVSAQVRLTIHQAPFASVPIHTPFAQSDLALAGLNFLVCLTEVARERLKQQPQVGAALESYLPRVCPLLLDHMAYADADLSLLEPSATGDDAAAADKPEDIRPHIGRTRAHGGADTGSHVDGPSSAAAGGTHDNKTGHGDVGAFGGAALVSAISPRNVSIMTFIWCR
jgi:hypothetical protein